MNIQSEAEKLSINLFSCVTKEERIGQLSRALAEAQKDALQTAAKCCIQGDLTAFEIASDIQVEINNLEKSFPSLLTNESSPP